VGPDGVHPSQPQVIDALAERGQVDSTTVVDVGTGRGFEAAGLAARVIGVGNLPAMLGAACDNLAALDANDVRVVEADLDALPLASDSVDVAVDNMVFHHAPALQRRFARWPGFRRPGGGHRRDGA
jgi:SAM-dependent methyltransferase